MSESPDQAGRFRGGEMSMAELEALENAPPAAVLAAAKAYGLDPDDLWWHVEAVHGWESHDEGYAGMVPQIALCAVRSRDAGRSPRECLPGALS